VRPAVDAATPVDAANEVGLCDKGGKEVLTDAHTPQCCSRLPTALYWIAATEASISSWHCLLELMQVTLAPLNTKYQSRTRLGIIALQAAMPHNLTSTHVSIPLLHA
jgi:hypothetical protein